MTTVTVPVPATTVQVPASTIQYALQVPDCIATLTAAGYTVTQAGTGPTGPTAPPPPGKLTVSANAFTVKADYPGYLAPTGKILASVSALGTGSATFMTGSSTHFPFLVQGVNGAWAGGAMSIGVTAKFTDGSTASLGTQSVTLPMTNGGAGQVVPQDGKMYGNGTFYGKGDFDFGGATVDYYYIDKNGIVCARIVETTGGGGWQPYWPVTTTAGMDPTKHTNFVAVVQPDVDMAFLISCMSNGDVQDGVGVTTTQVKAGVQTTISIAVSTFKFTNPLLKFSMGSSTHLGNGGGFNVYSVGFV